MDVILQENFPSLGYVGDRVAVKGGYARNFLIPRGIAVEASSRNERLLKHRLQHIMAKRIRMKGEAEVLAQKLSENPLDFTLKMSDSGKSFGSITARDIEAALKAKGFELDRKQIRITEALRKAGEFKVFVKLHAEVTASVAVRIGSEAPEVKERSSEKDAKKPRGRKRAAAADESEPHEGAAASAETEEKPAKKGTRKKKAADTSEE